MAKFIIEATRTTTYRDEVEAESLEQAIAITDEWIADDFTQVGFKCVSVRYEGKGKPVMDVTLESLISNWQGDSDELQRIIANWQ